jgi:hypothetical protein
MRKLNAKKEKMIKTLFSQTLYGFQSLWLHRLIVLAIDVERTKKPKLPKKRILKKINRR